MLDDIGLSLMMLDDAIGVHEKMAFRANVQKKDDGIWIGGFTRMCHVSVNFINQPFTLW